MSNQFCLGLWITLSNIFKRIDQRIIQWKWDIYQDAAELHIVEIVQQFEHLVRP